MLISLVLKVVQYTVEHRERWLVHQLTLSKLQVNQRQKSLKRQKFGQEC